MSNIHRGSYDDDLIKDLGLPLGKLVKILQNPKLSANQVNYCLRTKEEPDCDYKVDNDLDISQFNVPTVVFDLFKAKVNDPTISQENKNIYLSYFFHSYKALHTNCINWHGNLTEAWFLHLKEQDNLKDFYRFRYIRKHAAYDGFMKKALAAIKTGVLDEGYFIKQNSCVFVTFCQALSSYIKALPSSSQTRTLHRDGLKNHIEGAFKMAGLNYENTTLDSLELLNKTQTDHSFTTIVTPILLMLKNNTNFLTLSETTVVLLQKLIHEYTVQGDRYMTQDATGKLFSPRKHIQNSDIGQNRSPNSEEITDIDPNSEDLPKSSPELTPDYWYNPNKKTAYAQFYGNVHSMVNKLQRLHSVASRTENVEKELKSECKQFEIINGEYIRVNLQKLEYEHSEIKFDLEACNPIPANPADPANPDKQKRLPRLIYDMFQDVITTSCIRGYQDYRKELSHQEKNICLMYLWLSYHAWMDNIQQPADYRGSSREFIQFEKIIKRGFFNDIRYDLTRTMFLFDFYGPRFFYSDSIKTFRTTREDENLEIDKEEFIKGLFTDKYVKKLVKDMFDVWRENKNNDEICNDNTKQSIVDSRIDSLIRYFRAGKLEEARYLISPLMLYLDKKP